MLWLLFCLALFTFDCVPNALNIALELFLSAVGFLNMPI